jgi:hypothetical protein
MHHIIGAQLGGEGIGILAHFGLETGRQEFRIAGTSALAPSA